MAIKVIPAHLVAVGRQECGNLGQLQAAHAGGPRRVVRMLDRFMAEGCLCIVFDCLGASLHDARAAGRLSPLSLSLLRSIALQSMQGLAEVHNAGLIHADIKPHNILMGTRALHNVAVQQAVLPSLPLGAAEHSGLAFHAPTCTQAALDPESTQVNLIDLGNAIAFGDVHACCSDFEVAPLGYRAPELLLGCPAIDFKIDVWGLGMVLLEMALNDRVVNALSAQHALGIVADLLGPLPKSLLQRSSLPQRAAPFTAATAPSEGMVSPGSAAHCSVAVGLLLRQQKSKWASVPHLVGFLGGCLALEPQQRMSPLQALQHPFLESLFPLRSVLPPAAVEALHRCSAAAGADAAVAGRAPGSGPTVPIPASKRPRARGVKRQREKLSGLGALTVANNE